MNSTSSIHGLNSWINEIGKIIENSDLETNTISRKKFNCVLQQNTPIMKMHTIDLLIQVVVQALTKKEISIKKTFYQDLAIHIRKSVQRIHVNALNFPLSLKIEMAKLAAQENGARLSTNIKAYKIDASSEEGQNGLIEIAKLAAKSGGLWTSIKIKDFAIRTDTEKGRRGLIKIAKIAARQSESVSEYIQNYEIDEKMEEGQEALIKIAMLAAQENGAGTSKNIKKFGIDGSTIKGQRALIAIAKISAQQNGEGTSRYIQEYGIDEKTEEGLRALIEIAMLAAQENGAGASKYIQNYRIDEKAGQGREVLIKIAHLSVRQGGLEVLPYLNNYLIEKNEDWVRIKNGFAIHAAAALLENIINAGKPYKSEKKSFFKNMLCEPLVQFLFQCENDLKIEDLVEKIRQISSDETAIPDLLKQIMGFKKTEKMSFVEYRHIQYQQLSFLMKVIGDFLISNVDKKTLKNAYASIIKMELQLRDPKLRDEIWSFLFSNFLTNQNRVKELQKLHETCGRTGHSILPCIFLAFLENKEKGFQEIAKNIKALRTSSGTYLFKDATLYKLLLHLFVVLCKDSALTSINKKTLLEKALAFKLKGKADKVKIIKALQSIKGIVELGGEENLRDLESIPEDKLVLALSGIHAHAFKQVIPIRGEIADFTERFEGIFGKFREPDTIFIYASALKQIRGKEGSLMMSSLALCIEEVIEHKFPLCRYEGSEHLEKVFDGRSELKVKWREGKKLPLSMFLEKKIEKTEEISAIDFQSFLLKSFKEKHVHKKAYFELYRYLKESDSEARTLIFNEMQKKHGTAKSEEAQKNIFFQIKLMQLANNDENPEDLLADAINVLPLEGHPQFNADIDGLYRSLKTLRTSKESYSSWTIEDTDDLCDLFLCGTEVEGSCQRVNGQADLNKCLLAYVQDGKNRLLAIKDSNGKIKARAIFRLLLNSQSQQPVLFFERIYPQLARVDFKRALIEFAIMRSRDLKLPIVSVESGNGTPYQEELLSLGSRAPYEYVDARSEAYRDGQFTISQEISILL